MPQVERVYDRVDDPLGDLVLGVGVEEERKERRVVRGASELLHVRLHVRLEITRRRLLALHRLAAT